MQVIVLFSSARVQEDLAGCHQLHREVAQVETFGQTDCREVSGTSLGYKVNFHNFFPFFEIHWGNHTLVLGGKGAILTLQNFYKMLTFPKMIF
jgi:hypothetical protein